MHLEIHNRNVKIFECDKCENIYGTEKNLKSHYKVHEEGMKSEEKLQKVLKDNKCEICDKTFGRPSELNRHIKRNLKSHVKVHEGMKSEEKLQKLLKNNI